MTFTWVYVERVVYNKLYVSRLISVVFKWKNKKKRVCPRNPNNHRVNSSPLYIIMRYFSGYPVIRFSYSLRALLL